MARAETGTGRGGTAICTWFVSDNAGEATYSPQLGQRSDAPKAQAVYWRCTLCFYASSIIVNPGRRHVFFTNADLPVIDGVAVAHALEQWGVEVVHLPITYRLPKGAVQSWGSQFYTFDVISHLARSGTADRYLILDSDCLWIKSADALEAELDREGVLSYLLGTDEYPEDMDINGLSRAGLARFLSTMREGVPATIPYFGGEFFAATHAEVIALSDALTRVWPKVFRLEPDAPKEDGHMLSILFGLGGYRPGTANPFIRRMWTTFRHNNLRREDAALTLWHLPAEKKAGFAELFRRISEPTHLPMPDALGFDLATYRRAMGIPRRRPAKFVRDFTAKVREKLRR